MRCQCCERVMPEARAPETRGSRRVLSVESLFLIFEDHSVTKLHTCIWECFLSKIYLNYHHYLIRITDLSCPFSRTTLIINNYIIIVSPIFPGHLK